MKLLVVMDVSGGSGKALGVQSGTVILGTVSFPKNAQIKVDHLETVLIDKASAEGLAKVIAMVRQQESQEKPGAMDLVSLAQCK